MNTSNVDASGAILAINGYYARNAADVGAIRATRLRACSVRVDLGVPAGRVLRAVESHESVPEIMWDCPFVDEAAHEQDMSVRAASEAFEACRLNMRTLTRRFERLLYARGSGDDQVRDATLLGQQVTQYWIYIDDDQSLAGPDRLREPVCAAQGMTVRRRVGSGKDVPAWIIEAADDIRGAGGIDELTRFARRVLTCRWERIL